MMPATLVRNALDQASTAMSTADDFTLEEMAAAVRTGILYAFTIAAKATSSQRRRLVPDCVCVSALLANGGPLHDPGGERFRLFDVASSSNAAAELVEFHWLFDTPDNVRIVRGHGKSNRLAQG